MTETAELSGRVTPTMEFSGSPIMRSRTATRRQKKLTYRTSPDSRHDRIMCLGSLQLARRALEADAPQTVLHDLIEDAPPDCSEAEFVLGKFAEPQSHIPVYQDHDRPVRQVAEDQLPAQPQLRGSFLSFAAVGRNWDSTRNSANRACGTGSLGTPVTRHRALHNSKTLGPDQAQIPAGCFVMQVWSNMTAY
jgi:hypothetical protein